MTTSAAENLAGQAGEKDKDKVEKRRALGRGLESLLPGPRVVSGSASPGRSGAAGEQQVPHFVRNDKTISDKTSVDNTAADKTAAGKTTIESAVGDDVALAAGETGPSAPASHESDPHETIRIYAQAESRMPGIW